MFSEEGKKRADSQAFMSKIEYESVTISEGKTTSFSYDFGTNETGQPIDVTDVTEAMDCVIIG